MSDTAQLASAETVFAQLWREFLAPPSLLTVTEWSESCRVLSSKDSSEPGPYRVARTPFAAEPMNCLSQTSSVEEVVLMWGAQTSKTTVGSNWLGYLVDSNPGPIMIVQPTIDMAKRYSRQRLAPMIEESPALRRRCAKTGAEMTPTRRCLKNSPAASWPLPAQTQPPACARCRCAICFWTRSTDIRWM